MMRHSRQLVRCVRPEMMEAVILSSGTSAYLRGIASKGAAVSYCGRECVRGPSAEHIRLDHEVRRLGGTRGQRGSTLGDHLFIPTREHK